MSQKQQLSEMNLKRQPQKQCSQNMQHKVKINRNHTIIHHYYDIRSTAGEYQQKSHNNRTLVLHTSDFQCIMHIALMRHRARCSCDNQPVKVDNHRLRYIRHRRHMFRNGAPLDRHQCGESMQPKWRTTGVRSAHNYGRTIWASPIDVTIQELCIPFKKFASSTSLKQNWTCYIFGTCTYK